MSDEFSKVFREVTSSTAGLGDLHPRKLDRWWTVLVGAPEPIYMQLGCNVIFKQVDLAAHAVGRMIELLGEDNLPLSPQEIAQRHIKHFGWHVPSKEAEGGTFVFQASWRKDTSSWSLTCAGAPDVTRTVGSLEQAVEKAQEWADALDAQLRENTEESA